MPDVAKLIQIITLTNNSNYFMVQVSWLWLDDQDCGAVVSTIASQ